MLTLSSSWVYGTAMGDIYNAEDSDTENPTDKDLPDVRQSILDSRAASLEARRLAREAKRAEGATPPRAAKHVQANTPPGEYLPHTPSIGRVGKVRYSTCGNTPPYRPSPEPVFSPIAGPSRTRASATAAPSTPPRAPAPPGDDDDDMYE